jgi:hypothetical protein
MPNPGERVEVRDGKEFKVTVLPEAKPPKKRSAKTHFHHSEVGKPGDVPQAKTRSRNRNRKRKS